VTPRPRLRRAAKKHHKRGASAPNCPRIRVEQHGLASGGPQDRQNQETRGKTRMNFHISRYNASHAEIAGRAGRGPDRHTKVIPAMQRAGIPSRWNRIRGREKAEAAARQFGIPKAYGSYDRCWNDPEIEAILQHPSPSPHLRVLGSRRRAGEARAVRKTDRPPHR